MYLKILTRIPATLLFTCLMVFAQAQTDTTKTDKRSFSESTYFGGGLGLQFGTITSIQVSPMMGYKIDKAGKLSAGAGITYWYYKDNRNGLNFEATQYGYSVFNRYRFIENLFTHIEFQQMNVQRGNAAFLAEGQKVDREWVPFLYLGAGYAAEIGGGVYMMGQVMWDVIQDNRSPYLRGQPIFNVGIGAGF